VLALVAGGCDMAPEINARSSQALGFSDTIVTPSAPFGGFIFVPPPLPSCPPYSAPIAGGACECDMSHYPSWTDANALECLPCTVGICGPAACGEHGTLTPDGCV
jgi:hypothetical protein